MEEIENLSYVQSSLHWTFMALTEIYFLNKERRSEEIELLNGPPFQYYRISLHYMFIMEYKKLLEHDNANRPLNNFASLEKLSNVVLDKKGDLFKAKHEKNLSLLTSIRESAFFKKIKDDRDKKFAHSDGNYADPFSFSSFSDEEILLAQSHLKLFKIIMDNCTILYNNTFEFQHTDPRTDNFIKFYTNYKEYYYANYMDAISKGYH